MSSIRQPYPASAEVYRGPGRLYLEHPECGTFHHRYRPGLAGSLAVAMAHCAGEVLAEVVPFSVITGGYLSRCDCPDLQQSRT